MQIKLCLIINNNDLYKRVAFLAEQVSNSLRVKLQIVAVEDTEHLKAELMERTSIVLFDGENTFVLSDEFVNTAMLTDYNALIICVAVEQRLLFRFLPARPFGLIEKEKIESELVIMLKEAIKEIQKNNEQALVFELSDGLIRAFPHEIICVENNCIFLDTKEVYSLKINRGELKEKFSHNQYLWLNSNCIINICNIESFNENIIIMKNGRKYFVENKNLAFVEKQIRGVLY